MSSLVHEGTSYDEVFPSGRELEEESSRSPEREQSTQLLSDENEDEGDVEDEYDKGKGDGVEEDEKDE